MAISRFDGKHGDYMDRAVTLAWKGRKKVAPNPMVGAVIVKGDKILGEGYHRAYGDAHAEVEAIEDAKRKKNTVRGATLYVTLEPCCHWGKQAPCTQSIQKAGFKHVFFAQKDPNPSVNGKGEKELKKNGISISPLETWESHALNAIYLKNIREKLPFVHVKTACTQDGKITLKKGAETPLGGTESMVRVHRLRDRYDGIVVGVQTVLIDDPKLTSRIPHGQNPLRIILDNHLRTPRTAQLFKEKGSTVIVTTMKKIPKMWSTLKNIEIWNCAPNAQGRVDIDDFLKKCFEKGVRSLLVEGGEQVNTSFLRGKMIDSNGQVRGNLSSEQREREGEAPYGSAGWRGRREPLLIDRLTVVITPKMAHGNDLPSVFQREALSTPLTFQKTRIENVGKDLWYDGFTER